MEGVNIRFVPVCVHFAVACLMPFVCFPQNLRLSDNFRALISDLVEYSVGKLSNIFNIPNDGYIIFNSIAVTSMESKRRGGGCESSRLYMILSAAVVCGQERSGIAFSGR